VGTILEAACEVVGEDVALPDRHREFGWDEEGELQQMPPACTFVSLTLFRNSLSLQDGKVEDPECVSSMGAGAFFQVGASPKDSFEGG
jgi:hypothetical protein